MNTSYAPNGFAETREALAWAGAYAPEFKGRFTLNEVFADLEHGLDTTRPTIKDAERLAILEQVRTKLRESKAAFATGQIKPAHRALQDASELFRSLRRPKTPPPGPDPGESADDTVDD
jgi:hypothetical protein